MNFRRFLHPESIRLDVATRAVPEGEDPDEFDVHSPNNLKRIRESLFAEIVELLDSTGEVANPRRLFKDLFDREKKAVSAIGQGIAIPHARTLQARSFLMAFCRSVDGLPFAAPDEEPVHLFFAMAAPPYDDRTYLKVYRTLAKSLLDPEILSDLMIAEEPSEILFALKGVE